MKHSTPPLQRTFLSFFDLDLGRSGSVRECLRARAGAVGVASDDGGILLAEDSSLQARSRKRTEQFAPVTQDNKFTIQ